MQFLQCSLQVVLFFPLSAGKLKGGRLHCIHSLTHTTLFTRKIQSLSFACNTCSHTHTHTHESCAVVVVHRSLQLDCECCFDSLYMNNARFFLSLSLSFSLSVCLSLSLFPFIHLQQILSCIEYILQYTDMCRLLLLLLLQLFPPLLNYHLYSCN